MLLKGRQCNPILKLNFLHLVVAAVPIVAEYHCVPTKMWNTLLCFWEFAEGIPGRLGCPGIQARDQGSKTQENFSQVVA